MLKILGFAALSGLLGYLLGALLGYMLVELLSSNRHDRSLEAAMTAFLVAGPLCALLGFASAIFVQLIRPR